MTWNRRTTEQQRVQRKRDYLNQRKVHVQQIPHLRDSFAFLPYRKESVTDLWKILDKNLSALHKETSTAYNVATSFYCFEFLFNGWGPTFEQIIADLIGVSVFPVYIHWAMHKVSRAIVKRKEHSLSFLENSTIPSESFIVGGRSKITVLLTILLFPPFSWHVLFSCE